MRIAIALTLAGLAACSRQPANTVDVTAIAAKRAKANIDSYAATKERNARRTALRTKRTFR